MATVTFNQPTDMSALPSTITNNKAVTHPGPGSTTQTIEVSGDNSDMGLGGTFTGYPIATGTIERAWIDGADLGGLPNIEVTGLHFAMDQTFYSTLFEAGNLQSMTAALLGLGDSITGSLGADLIFGYDGDDTMYGGPGGAAPDGADFFDGGNGFDTVSYAGAAAGLFAGIENTASNNGAAAGDTYWSVSNLIGTAFSDVLYGDPSVNRLSGGAGNDMLVGKGAGDTLDGGTGRDTAGYDDSPAGVWADLLSPGTNTGAAAADRYISIENLAGSSYNDVLLGDDAANVISGNIALVFPSGADRLYGRGGADTLNGNDNSDRLDGGLANDSLNGGTGGDTLIGGPGKDSLTGGPGADSFVFNAPPSAANLDLVRDFSHVDDTIQLENAVFKTLGAPGPLKSAFFFLGTHAHDANDHIIYNKANGALFYDVDGTGAHAQVAFAVLTTRPANVALGDFVVI
jgi:serralysin